MIKPLPLLNKKVLVPRGKKQAKPFSQLVEKYGGIPIEIPLIAFRPIHADGSLLQLLKSIDTYDWIIFTSNVTVETLLSFYNKQELALFPKIAVIGERTQKVLNENGLKVSFLPSEYVAEAFAAEFAPYVKEGDRILIPKGNLARDVIAESLRKKGAAVDEAIVYETYMPEDSRVLLSEKLAKKDLDILLFTSPSTVEHFMDVVKENKLGDLIEECLIGCIGPVTKEKIQSYGLLVHAAPEVYTVEEMLKSMIAYLN